MLSLKNWFAAILLLTVATGLQAEDGTAWKVQGDWRVNHTQGPIRRGDAVAPGALLTADGSTTATILLLMPDGQRLLFDCHDAHTCVQGFRIPALMEKPDADAVYLFNSVREAMRLPAFGATALQPSPTTAETEGVIAIQDDGAIILQQAIASLPPGQYRLTVQGTNDPQPVEQSLTWSGPHDAARLPLSQPGLYRLRLFGTLGGERMRILLLAESPQLFPSRQKDFAEAKKDLQEWNETFPGWPIHEWLQLFLQKLAHSQDEKSQ